jgi:hypothetical protein
MLIPSWIKPSLRSRSFMQAINTFIAGLRQADGAGAPVEEQTQRGLRRSSDYTGLQVRSLPAVRTLPPWSGAWRQCLVSVAHTVQRYSA